MKYSNTEQRRVLLEELCSTKTHPTAEELFQRVRQRIRRVSLATIYRNLDRMAEAGMVRKLERTGDIMRFDGDVTPHPHLRCRRCGAVEDLKINETAELMTLAGCLCKERIETVSVEFQGLCSRCAGEEASGNSPRTCKTPCQAEGEDGAYEYQNFQMRTVRRGGGDHSESGEDHRRPEMSGSAEGDGAPAGGSGKG